jgi:Amino acid permease
MSDQLTRQLRGRHIQLIAIGGTIGVGLFLGSAQAFQAAAPGLLASYVVAGATVFFSMRAGRTQGATPCTRFPVASILKTQLASRGSPPPDRPSGDALPETRAP